MKDSFADLGRSWGHKELSSSELVECAIWNLGLGLAVLLHQKGFTAETSPGCQMVFVRGKQRLSTHDEIEAVNEGTTSAEDWARKLGEWEIAGEPWFDGPAPIDHETGSMAEARQDAGEASTMDFGVAIRKAHE